MDDMQNMMGMMSNIGIIVTIVSILITVVVLFFVFRLVGNLSKSGQATQQLLMTGVPATATVLQLNDGGMLVNNNPMVDILLEVQSRSHGTYQASVRSLIPMIKLAQVQPGQMVNVKIDPANPQNVAIDLR